MKINNLTNQTLIEIIKPLLKCDNSWQVKELALEVLCKILKIEPSFANETVIKALINILAYEPSFANEKLLDKIKALLKDYEIDDSDVRYLVNYLAGTINGIIIAKRKMI